MDIRKILESGSIRKSLLEYNYTPQVAIGDFTAKEFPCVADPTQRWNGWAVPYFTLETVKEILKDQGLEITSESENEIKYMGDTGEEESISNAENGWTFPGWIWMLKGDYNDKGEMK